MDRVAQRKAIHIDTPCNQTNLDRVVLTTELLNTRQVR